MPWFQAPDDARLHYTDDGHGMALLCLAGITRSLRDFDYLLPHLPPLRLIRLDARGRGQSDWTGVDSYTIDRESGDVVALLDHLELDDAAILGTSRGGLVAMWLADTARERLRGICLNDIGPVMEPLGLELIGAGIGRNPSARSRAEAALALEREARGFAGVPQMRWMEEAERRFVQTEQGFAITYDPALRTAFDASLAALPADLWPMFDACEGLPLALIRGENSTLLSARTVERMQRRRPDMIHEDVPGRGHPPFLDEPESLRVIHQFLGLCL